MEEPYVAVVGGINLDICGKSFGPLRDRDSNPGAVRQSPGGVGRNIAHNLRLLDCPVCFLTALGDDDAARRLEADCLALGMDLSRALRVPGVPSSSYLAIEGPEGDMALALCDDGLTQRLDPAWLEGRRALLNGAAAVAAEANLSAEALAWLGDHVTAPLFVDPVSAAKAQRLRPILGKLFLLKPNRLEAELLSGTRITDRNSLELAAARLLSTGLETLCISLGRDGVYCARGTERCLVPCPETRLVNASGGGDAMMAGFLRAHLDGLPLAEAARLALACGSIAVEGAQTVNPALNYTAAKVRAVGAVLGRPPFPTRERESGIGTRDSGFEPPVGTALSRPPTSTHTPSPPQEKPLGGL